jgi:hypothetical protein
MAKTPIHLIEGGGTGEPNTNTNVGTGEGKIAKAKAGFDTPLRSLKASTGITIVENADDITISAEGIGQDNTNTNVGTGEGTIAKAKIGVDTPLKSLKAGAGVSIINNTNEILVSATSAGAGGSTTEIQFNQAGVLAGVPEFAWDNAKKDLNLNGLKINGLSLPTILADNTTSVTPIITRSLALYKFMIIEYSITRGTNSRTGVMKTTSDGTLVGYNDQYAELGDTGITLSASNAGSTIEVSYTSSNTGVNAEFKYNIKYWN